MESMNFTITSGVQNKAKKVVIYGPEGIGKTTFAAQFPKPLFIDTEGGTNTMDVSRLPKPTSWQMLTEEIEYVKQTRPCETLIIDTFDWAEQLCIDYICSSHQKNGIEDFGYGNGYVYEKEEVGKFLNSLEDVIEAGINIVLTCHAHIRKFEQPDEMGAYDRWELKLGKKTGSQISPLVKEWADMVLFMNYKTMSIQVDNKGKKFKAQGGQRVIYTSHHVCWDAKNRFNLPDEIPLDYNAIAHCLSNNTANTAAENQETVPMDGQNTNANDIPHFDMNEVEILPDDDVPLTNSDPVQKINDKRLIEPLSDDLSGIPKDLADLMRGAGVTREEIQLAVSNVGYYPRETPIENYDPAFISGCLVGAWNQVYSKIEEIRKEPF